MNCDVCGKAMTRFQPKGEPVKWLCSNEKAHPAILAAKKRSENSIKSGGRGKPRPKSNRNLPRSRGEKDKRDKK